ncbi:hypothetical protein [Fervidibacter sacchari]
MEQQTLLTERVVALILARLEQESDPEKAAKWIELLERVTSGQIRRYDTEKSQASPQSQVPEQGR